MLAAIGDAQGAREVVQQQEVWLEGSRHNTVDLFGELGVRCDRYLDYVATPKVVLVPLSLTVDGPG